MRLQFSIAIFVSLSLAPFSSNGGDFTYPSYPPDGNQYDSTITNEMEKESPSWLPQTDNPPISAKNAIHLAKRTLHKTIPQQFDNLKVVLVGATLTPMRHEENKWYWDVRSAWEGLPGTGATGIPHDFHVLILMNGKVVEPKRQKHNDRP
jgi:hypothetical protein